MIQQQTVLKVSDNSGAKKVKCIKVLGGFKRKYAVIGDIIIVSIHELRNKSRKTSKVLKGEVCKALVLRTRKKTVRKDGSIHFFNDNCVSLLNKQEKPIATRVFGPLYSKIKNKNKLVGISSGFF